MGIFDWLFGEIEEGVQEGVKEGLEKGFEKGLEEGLKSEMVQLSFDRLIQRGYDRGRKDEKLGKPHINFTQERHERERKHGS